MKNLIIINEEHELLEEQESILNQHFSTYNYFRIPKEGLTLKQQKEAVGKFNLNTFNGGLSNIIFISPVPYILGKVCSLVAQGETEGTCMANVYIFHNDKGDKKELPNGKIISVLSKTGWKLANIDL